MHCSITQITICPLENFPAFFCRSKSTFSKNSFRNRISVSNSLDPDQARHSVGPDLGPNCLQNLSADDTIGDRVNQKVAPNFSFSL